jgi:peroxiredoxin
VTELTGLRLERVHPSGGALDRRAHECHGGLEAAAARADARRAASVLAGRALPALSLTSTTGTPVQFARDSDPGAVIYLFPGGDTSPPPSASSSDGSGNGNASGARADAAQHRAFDERQHDLRTRSLRVFGVSSEPLSDQRTRVLEHRIGHQLISDPELEFARALELPTYTEEGVERYERLMLVAFAGRIAKAFYPVDSPQRSASQIICWLMATEH